MRYVFELHSNTMLSERSQTRRIAGCTSYLCEIPRAGKCSRETGWWLPGAGMVEGSGQALLVGLLSFWGRENGLRLTVVMATQL